MTAVCKIIEDKLPALPIERPRYWSSFVKTCTEVNPPFGQAWYGDLFRQSALDLNWLCRLLVINAQKEAFGACQLWKLAGRIDDESFSEKVRLHAIDESRHANFYIAMLELTFPNVATPDQSAELRKISPEFNPSDFPARSPASSEIEILDEIIQMNIGEVRTLINQMLLRPVLEVIAPNETKDKLLGLVDSLGRDELAHVKYTAEIIDEMFQQGDVTSLMIERAIEFSKITCDEVGAPADIAALYS
jgi:hypothetical protein